MVVYSFPVSTLTMTLYLSYPMTTMEMMEPVPKMPPRQPYSRHAAALSGHVSRVTCHGSHVLGKAAVTNWTTKRNESECIREK